MTMSYETSQSTSVTCQLLHCPSVLFNMLQKSLHGFHVVVSAIQTTFEGNRGGISLQQHSCCWSAFCRDHAIVFSCLCICLLVFALMGWQVKPKLNCTDGRNNAGQSHAASVARRVGRNG